MPAAPVGRGAGDLDRRAQQLGVGHLRGHGALPDELVELQLVALEHALERLRRAAEVGGADRLVRFLGVADLGLVLARSLVVVVAVHLAHGLAGLAERLVAERGRVGAVIRDQALEVAAADVDALEQPLRDVHRAIGREPELAVGLLLQGRGGERRRRPLRGRLLVDARDAPRHAALEPVGERGGGRLVEANDGARGELAAGVEVLAGGDAAIVDADERGAELAPVGALERGVEVPVVRRAERQPLLLALDDQPHRHALHAAGAEAGLHLLPQHRRERVAVEPVEDAPALLGPHQVLVDVLVGVVEGARGWLPR